MASTAPSTTWPGTGASSLSSLTDLLAGCRLCRDAPAGPPLPHEPRPVFQLRETARILVAGQAPSTGGHATGLSFNDPSGRRLREWMGVGPDEFYDASRVAIAAMGFCYPGRDRHGADLPPRRECLPAWHGRIWPRLPRIDLVLAIGQHAQRHHLTRLGLAHVLRPGMTGTVEGWRTAALRNDGPAVFPLPHPSWRNTGWLRRHPWFEAEVLPALRAAVRARLDGG